MPTNPFYNATGTPAQGAFGYSASMRGEFQSIQSAFALLPSALTANKAWVNNASGTGVTLTVGSLALAGNFTTLGAYAVTFTATGATSVTLPTTGTLATLAGAETFTNKTFDTAVASGNTFKINGTQVITSVPTSVGGTGQTTYTNGQLLIGKSSDGSLAKATLTAAGAITITNGDGTITISAPTGNSAGSAYFATFFGGF